MKRIKKIKKIRVVVSNSSHMNWEVAHDFEVFDGNLIILKGTIEYDTSSVMDDDDSGDFRSGHRNYYILDTFKVTVHFKFVKYFPYTALKYLIRYFEADGIYLNW